MTSCICVVDLSSDIRKCMGGKEDCNGMLNNSDTDTNVDGRILSSKSCVLFMYV